MAAKNAPTAFEEFFPIFKREILKKTDAPIESERPKVLGIMGYEDHQLIEPKNLRYFIKPSPKFYPMNLNKGYDDYIPREKGYYDMDLKKLEKFLMDNDGRILLKSKQNQQICASRNALKTLMMTPYNFEPSSYNDWAIKATKLNNIIYMTKIKEDERFKTPVSTYHFKFQQYCFADSPYEGPDLDKIVNENDQLSCVFETVLDEFDIMYSAEISGVESQQPIEDFKNPAVLNTCKFVHIRLLPEHTVGRFGLKTHPKMLQSWVQSYLGRVENVYVGLRTPEGFVNRPAECIKLSDLPRGQKWQPDICKRFLRDFLKKVKATMHDVNCPYTTYEFRFDSTTQMIKFRVYESKSEQSFLSEEFLQYMQM